MLLDTHAFLWWVSDWQQMAEPARDAIADPRNEVFVSAVSGWEIAIKRAKGRLVAPDNLAVVVEEKGFGESVHDGVDAPSRRHRYVPRWY